MTATDPPPTAPRPAPAGDLFGLPLLCAGLCLIAVCVLVPQATANRRLAAERDQLRQDVAHVDAQLLVNGRFLAAGGPADPEVAERLAQRQLRQVRDGTTALRFAGRSTPAGATAADMLRVPTLPPVAVPSAPTGLISDLTRTTHRQLLGLAGGLFLVGAGLIVGPSRDGRPV